MTRRNSMDPLVVGERLRVLRQGRGETQREVAAVVGVGTTAVMRWEGGKHAPGEDNSRKLAAHFGVPIESLFEPQERVSNRVPVGELEPILDRLLSLRPDQVELLRGEAAALADAIRRVSIKAGLVADRLNALAAPGNGHQADGTSG